MPVQHKQLALLALALFTVGASADPVVYAINGSLQFGTMDLATGAFQQIGPVTPGEYGLVQGPSGSLLTLTFSGNLDSINPATGVTSVLGPTGLADCSMPSSLCGPTSANVIGKFGATIYATDFSNNLYTVNPTTGKATLIGATGIPGLPYRPMSKNPNGTINVYSESLFEVGGKLYADFDAIALNPETGAQTAEIPDDLYQINPSTGHATLVAPITLGLAPVVDVNGTVYAFDNATSQLVTLNVMNGSTSFVSDFDSALIPILGASPVPEPASLALAAIGIAGLVVWERRRRRL